MFHARTSAAALAAAGLFAGTAAAPATATTAAAATRPPVVAPTAATRPPVVKKIDVDGDGRADTVRLRLVRARDWNSLYRLTVTPARGKAASVDLSTGGPDVLTPAQIWQGAGFADGVRGAEIRLLDAEGGESSWYRLYSWRGGRLTVQREPSTRLLGWSAVNTTWFGDFRGYTFSTVGGQRRLVVHHLHRRGSRYDARHTTFAWRQNAWRQIAARSTASLTDKQAAGYLGWRGVRGLS